MRNSMNADRVRNDHPSGRLHGYTIRDSSNVKFVGWQDNSMLVWFKSGSLYRYDGVSRQQAVAAALAPSVGTYINRKIKSRYSAVRI